MLTKETSLMNLEVFGGACIAMDIHERDLIRWVLCLMFFFVTRQMCC